ncbi:MAG: carboxymuconolactone decarboxylase family protein [Promethearchaeati archaeon SRVP18_Atabeyarchaeia-1]
MPEQVEEILREFETYFAKMRKEIPETREAFTNLLGTVHKDGALSAKHKELICVAISVYAHCEACMVHHTRQAIEAGATRPEIMEACAAAIVMGGGPAATQVPIVMKSIEKWGTK